MKRNIIPLAIVVIALCVAGCRHRLWFPETPMSQSNSPHGGQISYDTDGDGRADYFEFIDESGRKSGIAYDYNNDAQPDSFVYLDKLPSSRCRHLVIILDGFTYDLVKDFYDKGHLRFFHPPVRVVAPFPTMTDLCIADALNHIPCLSYEALYYDRRKRRLTRGTWDYLHVRNEAWVGDLDYRGPIILDTFSYLSPWQVVKKQIAQAHSVFSRRDGREVILYFVGTAGMGTTNGTEGQLRCLRIVERLVGQVMCETRGLVKITMLADHGHTGKPFENAHLSKYLKQKGWRPAKRLRKKRDFVHIEFGLVTYAAFLTRDAPGLAADLAGAGSVDLAAYMVPEGVAVVSSRGSAVISEKDGRFRYRAQKGDVLLLKEVITKLDKEGKVDAEGYIDDSAFFEATVTHEYPDALRRLWRAFYGLVENVPDVVVSLKDEYCSGSSGYSAILKRASTHGGFNYTNSVTFIMSTAGPLPEAMRSDEIPEHLGRLFNRPFPYRR